jgi:hypothetical protein
MSQPKNLLLTVLPKFLVALQEQLESDFDRWGDEWRHRPTHGQEDRIFDRFFIYYDEWRNGGVPMPWLKIAGLAFIAWVRINYPTLLYSEK